MRLPVLMVSALALYGCATAINPDAHPVTVVSHIPEGSACNAVGSVTGHQGNWFTGWATPDAELELGANNDLKNKTLASGGNVVAVTDAPVTRHTMLGNIGVTINGQAFKCPSWN